MNLMVITDLLTQSDDSIVCTPYFGELSVRMRPKNDILRPDCRRKKPSAPYKKNIAITDCLQAGYSIAKQSAIHIHVFLFVYGMLVFFTLKGKL